jgi:hypothetical protein
MWDGVGVWGLMKRSMNQRLLAMGLVLGGLVVLLCRDHRHGYSLGGIKKAHEVAGCRCSLCVTPSMFSRSAGS